MQQEKAKKGTARPQRRVRRDTVHAVVLYCSVNHRGRGEGSHPPSGPRGRWRGAPSRARGDRPDVTGQIAKGLSGTYPARDRVLDRTFGT